VQEERDIAIVEVEDRPGSFVQILRRLAENELNVGPTYSITRNRIAIGADDSCQTARIAAGSDSHLKTKLARPTPPLLLPPPDHFGAT
jgi:hypothetical protein